MLTFIAQITRDRSAGIMRNCQVRPSSSASDSATTSAAVRQMTPSVPRKRQRGGKGDADTDIEHHNNLYLLYDVSNKINTWLSYIMI